MKRSVFGIALVAGVAFCGVQVLGTMPALPTMGTEVVAHASDAEKVVDSGTLGTCPWTLTADGVLHVKGGELPEAKAKYSGSDPITPFCDIQVREGEDQKNLKFNTISFDEKVTTPEDASFMFASFFTSIPQIKNWQNLDTSKSTNFSFMFYGSGQDTIDVSNFDTHKATNMHGMFSNTNLVEGYENLDTSNVTDMGEMFEGYGDENNLSSLNLSNFDVSKVNSNKGTGHFGNSVAGGFSSMFGAANVKSLNIGNWKPNIPLTRMFDGSNMSSISELTVSPQDNLTNSELLGPDTNDTKNPAYTGEWENANDQYLKPGDSNKTTYSTADLIGKYNGSSTATENETYQWEPKVTPGNPVTIHYIDQDGKMIQPDSQLPGALGAAYTVKPDTIKGYQYVSATKGSLTGTYTSDPQEVTLSYKVAPVTPVTPGGNGGTSNSTSESLNTRVCS